MTEEKDNIPNRFNSEDFDAYQAFAIATYATTRTVDPPVAATPNGETKVEISPRLIFACVDQTTVNGLTHKIKRAISVELIGLLRLLTPGGKKFDPMVGWHFIADDLGPTDPIVYFVDTYEGSFGVRVMSKVAVDKTQFIGPGVSAQGLTTGSSDKAGGQVCCEVFMMNEARQVVPAKRLAFIAFHEFMHGVLDCGRPGICGVADIHAIAKKKGISATPTEPEYSLQKDEIAHLNRNVMQPVKFYRGHVPEKRPKAPRDEKGKLKG